MVGGQRNAPAALPPGKTRYPLYRRQGGSQGRIGRAENLAPIRFDLRTFRAVASRYDDWTISTHFVTTVAVEKR